MSHVQLIDPRVQGDPTANRMRAWGDDLKHAKALVADLETVLRRLDEGAESLSEAGVRMTYTLGPVGDAAASTRRDIAKQKPTAFELPKGA